MDDPVPDGATPFAVWHTVQDNGPKLVMYPIGGSASIHNYGWMVSDFQKFKRQKEEARGE